MNNPISYSGPDPAHEWDRLWNEILIDITVIGVVFGIAAIWMLFRYKAKSENDVGTAQPLTKAQALAWALIPAAIFMADDFFMSAKGWTLWNTYRRVPENALEIKVTGYQWFWEFDYGDGVKVENTLTVPVGRPVVLRMSAEDVIHSFYLQEYRVKEDVMPGRVTYLWFLPTKPIEAPILCTEFCGLLHSKMVGSLKAMPPEEFETWLATEKAALAAKKS
jgi:cytochrome c oxidase subunit 2